MGQLSFVLPFAASLVSMSGGRKSGTEDICHVEREFSRRFDRRKGLFPLIIRQIVRLSDGR